MRRFLMMAALGAVLIGAPATVSAKDPVMTVSVGRVQLMSKAVARVSVTYSCQRAALPAGVTAWSWESASVAVDIRQATGSRIAGGGNQVDFNPTTCDGKPHTLVVSVAADPSGRPFRTGRAVVEATGWASGSWSTDDDSGGWVETADTGWSAVRIRK